MIKELEGTLQVMVERNKEEVRKAFEEADRKAESVKV
jgi:hypothetical protein